MRCSKHFHANPSERLKRQADEYHLSMASFNEEKNIFPICLSTRVGERGSPAPTSDWTIGGDEYSFREIDDNTILMGKSMNENPIAQLFN
jgi:hypothetical protein